VATSVNYIQQLCGISPSDGSMHNTLLPHSTLNVLATGFKCHYLFPSTETLPKKLNDKTVLEVTPAWSHPT